MPRTPVGSGKTFRSYDPHQSFLLPPSLDDWLPESHTARFISEVVDELVDLSLIYDSYVEAAGAPPYDPKMMLKLELYAYSIGVTSSREVERRCYSRGGHQDEGPGLQARIEGGQGQDPRRAGGAHRVAPRLRAVSVAAP